MKVLITGSNGFIGKSLVNILTSKGHEPVPLKRNQRRDQSDTSTWIPEKGICELKGIGHIDAVVHLAGEPVLGYWTQGKKERILNSRINGTKALIDAILKANLHPDVFLYASGTGAYGNRGDELLTEDKEFGRSFLSDLSTKLETTVSPAENVGIRVVHMMFGTVLGLNGGAFKITARMFKLGLGVGLGNGRQWYPWITIQDATSAILFCLENSALQGRVNVVAPHLVRNFEYTQMLAKAVSRFVPLKVNIPSLLARLIFSKGFADEILLNSARVEPRKLENSEFVWENPELKQAIQSLLR